MISLLLVHSMRVIYRIFIESYQHMSGTLPDSVLSQPYDTVAH